MEAETERLLLQSPLLLTGAYLDILDTFPSPVCFLISSVAWKLPWSLKGLLYGICQPLSNQVFSFCQMFAVYQKCCWWWNGIISVKFSHFYCIAFVPNAQLTSWSTLSCGNTELLRWGVYNVMHVAGLGTYVPGLWMHGVFDVNGLWKWFSVTFQCILTEVWFWNPIRGHVLYIKICAHQGNHSNIACV